MEAESLQATSVAHEANMKAREAQLDTAIAAGLEKFFRRGVKDGRFLPLKDQKIADTERFDFICDDIAGIHQELKSLNDHGVKREDFLLLQQRADLTNKIVFAAVGFILLAFMGAIAALVLK